MKSYKLFVILFLSLPFLAFGQQYFSKSFKMADDTDGNTGTNIQSHEDGYLILAGRKNDFGVEYAALAKVNQEGITEWKQTYYLENQDKPPDPGLTMVIDENKIYIACQYKNSVTELDIQLLCIDKNTHDTLWTKQYPKELNDYILQILETKDDALVMVSTSRISSSSNNLTLTKTDKSGNIIWETFCDDLKHYYPWQACIAKDDNILVACGAKEFGGFYEFGLLTKVNLSGEVLWTRKFNESESDLTVPQVTALNNGDIAFGWVKDTFAPGGTIHPFPPAVFILDSLGNTKSTYTFYHRFWRNLYTLRVLPDGDLLGIGFADGHPDSFGTGGWLFRMSPNGELLWQRAIADRRYEYGELIDATTTPDNGILATGVISTKDFPEEVHVWLLKIGGDGCYESNCTDLELLITPAYEAPLPTHPYRLYPNPGKDYFYIEGLTGVEEHLLAIYDLSGKLIRQVRSPQPGSIDIRDLPSGEYTIKITLKNNLFTTLKLIKP